MEICLMSMTLCILPFKVIEGHRIWQRSVGNLWLPVNVPLQPLVCLIPFLRLTAISVKNWKFSPSMYI